MKKYLIIFTFVLLTFLRSDVIAQTPTVSKEDTKAQIDELQTKIASRVAQLDLVEKRGIVGTVTDSKGTLITLTDLSGRTRLIDVDELTKFSSDTSKTYGISDISKNSYIGVLGIYNKQSRRILARQISQMQIFPKIVYGSISSIDSKNFEFTITKQNQQKVVIEVEDITKSFSYSESLLEKSGFSKMEIGQTVLAIGTIDKLDSSKILSTRIIVFPQIQLNSSINIQANPDATIPPSTGSGVKVYPL